MNRLSLGLCLAACAAETEFPSASTDIATGDIHITGVKADGFGSFSPIRVGLAGPEGEYGPIALTLVDGDRLVVRGAAGDLPLLRESPGQYFGDLGNVAGDLHVVLVRTVDQPLDLGIFVPPGFNVHVAAFASRAAPLTITWDAGAGPYSVELDVADDYFTDQATTPSCVARATRMLSFDSGSYTFNAYELAYPKGAPNVSVGSCHATVTVKRTTMPDPILAATQTRTASFESLP